MKRKYEGGHRDDIYGFWMTSCSEIENGRDASEAEFDGFLVFVIKCWLTMKRT